MEDRLEMLESAIYALDDAIDAVAALGNDYECDMECLKDMKHGYEVECREIKRELQKAADAEEAALTREYYRAVI